MSLPSLETYSELQLEQACQFSLCLKRYLSIAQTDQFGLHGLRQRRWAAATLATVHNTAMAQEVCREWSQTADEVITRVAGECQMPDGLALFAFGKLGAKELNLSSDVDLLLVAQDDRENHLPFLREFQNRMSTLTENGFLFRVDFELRPGGKMGPLIPTVDQLVDFYGNYGETWERLAFIRLRGICGDAGVISSIMSFSKKFVFRRHLDFSLLEDLKALRAKVHEHYWHRTTDEQIDLKLGVGGIRDLELFTHALQVVHGGKDPRLHISDTTKALEAFSSYEILPLKDVHFLTEFYWKLRTLENLVQSQNDQQTHLLPTALVLPAHGEAVRERLRTDMKKCDAIVSGLLGKISSRPLRLPEDPQTQQQWLAQMGYDDEEIRSVWPEILAMPVFSRNRERDLELRNKFLFQFIERMGLRTNRLPNGLSLLKDFLTAAKAKSSFFSLLLSNDKLLDSLAEIFSSSLYLSRIICYRPELLDSFLMRNVEIPSLQDSEMDEFLEALAEQRMLTEILSGSELLRGEALSVISGNLTTTADRITTQLLEKIRLQMQLSADESLMSIVALGKWGGRELGFHSDLDCVFVTETSPTEAQQKWIRRFINRLTESHRGGSLYSIDTRLKVSGTGGVLLTTFSQLQDYLTHSAEPWERQAYLKGRWIGVGPWTKFSLQQFCLQKKLTETDLSELNRIRLELQKNSNGTVDLKYNEGGLVDTEFAIQVACLYKQVAPSSGSIIEMLNVLSATQPLWKSWGPKLISNYEMMRSVEQLQKLLSDENSTALVTNSFYAGQIAGRLKIKAQDLERQMRSALAEQNELLKHLDPRRGASY